jgi:hypothetical protein
VQREDGRADLLDGLVQRLDRAGDPVSQLGVAGPRGHALQLHAGRVQSLDDQVVQVAGDPVAVVVDREPLGVATALRQFQSHPGLRGEGDQHLDGLRGQRQHPRPPPGGQDPADIARHAQRNHDSRAQAQALTGGRSHTGVGAEIGNDQGLTGFQHRPGH